MFHTEVVEYGSAGCTTLLQGSLVLLRRLRICWDIVPRWVSLSHPRMLLESCQASGDSTCPNESGQGSAVGLFELCDRTQRIPKQGLCQRGPSQVNGSLKTVSFQRIPKQCFSQRGPAQFNGSKTVSFLDSFSGEEFAPFWDWTHAWERNHGGPRVRPCW